MTREDLIAQQSLKEVEDYCNKNNIGIIVTITKGDNGENKQEFQFSNFNLFEKGEQVCVKTQEDVKSAENAEEYLY